MDVKTLFLSLKPKECDKLLDCLEPLKQSEDVTVAFFAKEVFKILACSDTVTNVSWKAFKKETETDLALMEQYATEQEDWAEGCQFRNEYGC